MGIYFVAKFDTDTVFILVFEKSGDLPALFEKMWGIFKMCGEL